MGRTLIVAEIDGMDVTHLNATLDILDEPICMNLGVAFMPFMENGYYFLKEDNINSADGLNDVETGFVEYLYKIRQANRNKTTLEYTYFKGPNRLNLRERVFIAGKIFPVMSISYSGKDINCSTSKIEKRNVNFTELRLLFGEPAYKEFSVEYISIDNDNIRIYLPKYSEMKIDYADLLIDFLTNGEKTKIASCNGEFPSMEIYKMATGNVNLQKACWLTSDRKAKNDKWKDACMYIVEHKYQGVLAPFGQIADFYGLLKDKVTQSQHKSRWLKGAYKLVNALRILDGGSSVIANNVEVILSELNLGICDYAITQFYDLFYGKYKDNPLNTMEKAYKWDLEFVTYEQGTVAVPIYEKTSEKAIETFQAMADRDASLNPINAAHGTGAWAMKNFWQKVTPEFDDPWNGKVTDAGFRTDLPLLMLWLDRHTPKSNSFIGKVDSNGFLLEKYKKIIRPYEAK